MRQFLVLLGALLAASGRASAQSAERSLVIERFEAAIRVNPDASLDITETITPRFTGKWNGLFRTIPVEYRTPQGFNWSLRLKLISVTDADGNALEVEKSRERHYQKFKIWVPGAEDATRTVVLTYRATNGLRFFEDHDELYWNITGDEWEVPIEAASARIELPGAASGIRAIAFNGVYGATSRDAIVTTSGTTVSVMMPKQLDFREGMTAVVGWNKGVVVEPPTSAKAAGFVASNWPLAIPVPVFVLMLLVWKRRGRDPDPLPITVQYDAPAQLTPGEAGTLLDHSVDMRDITATLVDLAVRGFIRIEEEQESRLFGLLKNDEFVFHRLKDPSEWRGLKIHERELLEGLFPHGEASVELSELENQFYKSIKPIQDGILDGLVARGFYQARPDRVKAGYMAGGVLVGALMAVGGSALSPQFDLTPVPFIIAGVVVGLIMLWFGWHMPARTVAGARAVEQIKGFEEFLGRTEGDRLRDFVRTPEMFEKFLPFAMAFGVEKKWALAFKGICNEPPRWYAGAHPGSFNIGTFSTRLSDLSTRASTTMASSPRSSSGSGFSGGSSGGGGGGGGGGGF